MKKKIILNILKAIYPSNKNKSYLLIDNKEKYKKLKKLSFKKNNIIFTIIDIKKFKLLEIISIFYLINKSFKIQKNFFIFFHFKKEIVGHNFFPDWPGNYKFSSSFRNIFFWLKQFISSIIFYRNIEFIAIKFK
ncbi:hypothetical protein N8084_01115 [Pelagibacteraceae bacterium]|nr:hypothetical protein [Pelagibacteraceae bacterium]